MPNSDVRGSGKVIALAAMATVPARDASLEDEVREKKRTVRPPDLLPLRAWTVEHLPDVGEVIEFYSKGEAGCFVTVAEKLASDSRC